MQPTGGGGGVEGGDDVEADLGKVVIEQLQEVDEQVHNVEVELGRSPDRSPGVAVLQLDLRQSEQQTLRPRCR